MNPAPQTPGAKDEDRDLAKAVIRDLSIEDGARAIAAHRLASLAAKEAECAALREELVEARVRANAYGGEAASLRKQFAEFEPEKTMDLIESLGAENAYLRRENQSLRQRVEELEAQRQEEYYQQETEPQPEEPTPGESG